jgi:hypothetical protein
MTDLDLHIGLSSAVLPARSKQVYMEWLEATVLLSIYLRSELILIDTKASPARCPLADALGSACETPPRRHHLATWQRKHSLLATILWYLIIVDTAKTMSRIVGVVRAKLCGAPIKLKNTSCAECETYFDNQNNVDQV